MQPDYDGHDLLSYRHLDGEWALFYKIARHFVHKVKKEDRADFLHDLLLEMAKVKAKYGAKGKPLTEAGLMRVASYEVCDYWENFVLVTFVLIWTLPGGRSSAFTRLLIVHEDSGLNLAL